MKIVSDVYNEFGKALLGVGQAMLVAALIAKFFTKEPISWWAVIAGIVFSFVPTAWGLFSSKKLIMPKKERKPTMNEFLVGAAFVALVSTVVGLFLLYHARKQEEEFKKHAGQK